MAEKKDKKEEGAGEGKKNKKLILFAIGALVLVAVIIVGGSFFIEKKQPPPEEKKQPAQSVPVPDLSQKPDIGPMIEVKEFIVNIISQDNNLHYVKATLSIEVSSPSAQAEVNQRMPQIRDAILMLVGNKTYEELQDLQGKRQLKSEMISKINTFLRTGRVNNIYFTDFVVQ